MRNVTWWVLTACAPKAASPSPAAALPDTLAVSAAGLAVGTMLDGAQAPSAPDVRPEDYLVPVGVWVTAGEHAAFTYVDPSAGLSMGADLPLPPELAAAFVEGEAPPSMHTVARLSWKSPSMRVLSQEEIVARGLPAVPEWLSDYGPQPPAGTLWAAWRLDPRLWGRFHPDYPDDVEVLFDDQPPTGRFELMWVRVTGCEAERCTGTLLNAPFRLQDVREGDEVWFSLATARAGHYLLMDGADGPLVPVRTPPPGE